MADPTDLATEREEKELERAISAARSQTTAAPVPGAECRNECGDPAAAGSHYCSGACRDDFAERKERLRRMGLKG